ncbi:MAG: NAD(P)-binding protein [Deltaproteobacteria bacterium]|nr:NAD(P)-binding protein [Deltaproteobacteria bacterium]
MPFAIETWQSRYRIAIIGGGPAGSACALALARLGVSDVVMIEAGDYQRFRIGESIPPESRRLFHALGIEREFLEQGHAPCYGSCSYWGSEARGYNDSLMNPLGHGWHLDRCRFDRFLASQAHARGVQVHIGATLTHSTPKANGFTLDIQHATPQGRRMLRIHADQVVDASGTRAVFARQRGSLKQGSHPLICLAALLGLRETAPPSSLSHLEAVEQGWWYGAFLPDARLLLALYSNAASIKAGQLWKSEQWRTLLAATRHIAALADQAAPLTGRIASFPAPSYCLDHVGGRGWLAIGDAASAYDPIASQGICKALANGLLAAEVLQAQSGLERYAQAVHAAYQDYLALRRHWYGLEQRWPHASFWKKFHERIAG